MKSSHLVYNRSQGGGGIAGLHGLVLSASVPPQEWMTSLDYSTQTNNTIYICKEARNGI